MAGRTHRDVTFEAHIEVGHFGALVIHVDDTIDGAVRRGGRADRRPMLTGFGFTLGVTTGERDAPLLVDAVIHEQGHFVTAAVIAIPVRLANEGLRADIAKGAGQQRAFRRQELRRDRAIILLAVQQQADGGVVGGQPGD